MRPTLKAVDLITYCKVAKVVFEAIADLKYYKALYMIQVEYRSTVQGAIGKIFENKELANAGVAWANSDENYNTVFNILIENSENFNKNVPLRDSDFKVQHGKESITYFWIDERVEVSFDGFEYMMATLIVDEKNNELHYDMKNEDRVGTYEENGLVGKAYKSFLAERELLK